MDGIGRYEYAFAVVHDEGSAVLLMRLIAEEGWEIIQRRPYGGFGSGRCEYRLRRMISPEGDRSR
jgi:hypothetical protein